MRSELVFNAMAYVSNFLLTKLASMATRKLHRPNTRIQDTTNDAFVRFSRTNPIAGGDISHSWQPFRCAERAEAQAFCAHPKHSLLRRFLVSISEHGCIQCNSTYWIYQERGR